MKSRFLVRIDTRIESEVDPFERACLSLERASYLARRGNVLQAQEIINDYRSDGKHLQSGKVSAWINYAEGMNSHIEGNDPSARLKWMRCLAIAQSIKASSLLSRTLSWLAFLDYNSIKTESLIRNIREAIRWAACDDFEAIARINLIIAQCFHLCGDPARAREFYDRCRLACVSSSDDVMLAALIHNMAWLRAAAQRNELLQGRNAREDRFIVELGAESTRNYEQIIGSMSFDTMTPLLGAQIDLIAGRYADVIRSISERIGDIGNQGLSRIYPVLLADRAYCRAELGDIDGAEADADGAIAAISNEDHIDDLAVLFTRLSKVYKISGNNDLSMKYSFKAKSLWAEYESLQSTMLLQIDDLAKIVAKM